MSINSVVLVGRVATEIDLRYTPEGKGVAKFNLAVDRGFGDKKKTSFLPIVVWEKKAEATANFSGKGKLIGIEGYIQARSYDGKDGQKRYVTEIIATEVQFLSPKDAEPSDFIAGEIEELEDSLPF